MKTLSTIFALCAGLMTAAIAGLVGASLLQSLSFGFAGFVSVRWVIPWVMP